MNWRDAFSDAPPLQGSKDRSLDGNRTARSLEDLAVFLDRAHITHCLLRPYFEVEDYPLVQSRELLPSFEVDLYEYKDLPGFSLVALERPLSAFEEVFQYDALHSLADMYNGASPDGACLLDNEIIDANLDALRDRLPKRYHEKMLQRFGCMDICALENYPDALDFLLQLERAQVMALDSTGEFTLAGVYASLPSDLDAELKRFGVRVGKFKPGDNIRYELNRRFVYQFLMELHGFSIVSERRTSAAMFARRLHRQSERFLVRVLGQSDRTITTLSSPTSGRRYPRVDKVALVQVDQSQTEAVELLEDQGFFVDPDKRVVTLRVTYNQHRFNPRNVQEDRALSVRTQEIIHPLTGRVLTHLNIIKEPGNMILQVNDIVRGEYRGSITYKRTESIEDPDTHELRLKFLYSWLSKHQRRIIGYSDESFGKLVKVLDSYLLAADNFDAFSELGELHQEVFTRFSFIRQSRRIKGLEDLSGRRYKGQRVGYAEMLQHMVDILSDLKFEIVNYFEEPVQKALGIARKVLDDKYLCAHYVDVADDSLTEYGLGIKRLYGRLVGLVDDIAAIRQSRTETGAKPL